MDLGYCDHCGRQLGDRGDHVRCREARQLEPPRFCSRCGRRMIVQVTPHGWTGRCAAHGMVTAQTG